MSTATLDEYLQPLNSCFSKERNCNVIAPWSNVFLDNSNDPATHEQYNTNKKSVTDFEDKCNILAGDSVNTCCDPNNPEYDRIQNSQYFKDKYNIKVKPTATGLEKCTSGEDDQCNHITPHQVCRLGTTKADELISAVHTAEYENKECSKNMCQDYINYVAQPFSGINYRSDDIEIVQCIHEDDLDKFKSIFIVNGKPDQKLLSTKLQNGYPGNTPLLEAISFNASKITLFIIKHATSNDILNDYNVDNNTALHLSCLLGESVLAHMLTKYGADTSKQNQLGDTPLHSATRSGEFDVVSVLLNVGASVSAENNLGETPLHSAVMAKNKNVKTIQELLKYGSDVLHVNNSKMTACDIISKFNKTKKNEEIRTILHNAVIERIRNNGLNNTSITTQAVGSSENQFMKNYRIWINLHPNDAFFDFINPENKERYKFDAKASSKITKNNTDINKMSDFVLDVSLSDNITHDKELYRSPVQNNIKDMKEIYENVLRKEHKLYDHDHDQSDEDVEHFTNNIETFSDFNRRFKPPKSNSAIMIYVITIIFFILVVFMVSLKYN